VAPALDDYPAELAAMLIYLNRTGYNGLFRLNASGEFNVPPGRYDSPKVIDRPLLTRVSEVLMSPGVRIEHAAFDRVLQEARAGDFVYFDPPVRAAQRDGEFSRLYRTRLFGGRSGAVAAGAHHAARTRRAGLLSNSVAPSVSRLYEDNRESRRPGSKLAVSGPRAINSTADRRGAVEELVVSNVRPRRRPAERGVQRRQSRRVLHLIG
jgi:DNA adenine methylase